MLVTIFVWAVLVLHILYGVLLYTVDRHASNESQRCYMIHRSGGASLAAAFEHARRSAPLLSPDRIAESQERPWCFTLEYERWYAEATIWVVCREDEEEDAIVCRFLYSTDYPAELAPVALRFGPKRSLLMDYVRLLELEFGPNLCGPDALRGSSDDIKQRSRDAE